MDTKECPVCDSKRVQKHHDHNISWCNDCHAIFSVEKHSTRVHAVSGNVLKTEKTTIVFNNDVWDWHDYGSRMVVTVRGLEE